MSSADAATDNPPATDAEAAVTEEAPPAERPYTAADLQGLYAKDLYGLVERQISLWPHKSGKEKWHPSRKPNMDVIKKVLLSDAGFTTPNPLPSAPSAPQVISKSHAPSKRTTTSRKEAIVAQASKDGKIQDTAVVVEARKIGLQPAIPPVRKSTTASPEHVKTGESEQPATPPDAPGGSAASANSGADSPTASGAAAATGSPPSEGRAGHNVPDSATTGYPGGGSKIADFPGALLPENLPATLFGQGGDTGDVSQNLLPGLWAEGSEGLSQIVDVFVCDLRNGGEKSYRQVQVHLASDRHSLYSVRSPELLTAIQGSADPIPGSGNVTAAVVANDILTVVAVVQDGELSDGGHPTVPVQFDVLTRSFSVALTVKARAGVKRTNPPSPSRGDIDGASTPGTAVSKRPKKSKKPAENTDTSAALSELSEKDKEKEKVARWLRAEIEKDPGWKDYDIKWGPIKRQDKDIFSEAVWIKNLAAKWENKFAFPEDTGCKRAFKLGNADMERALGKSHTWLGNKQRLARYGEYFGSGGPGEDPEVVDRLTSALVVPGGETKLREFLAEINAKNGSPCKV